MRIWLPKMSIRRQTRDLGLLLLFVALLQFGAPVTLQGEVQTGLYMLLYAGVIVFGLLAVRDDRRKVALITPLALVFAILATWFVLAQESLTATAAMLVSVAFFLFALMAVLVHFIFRRRREAGVDLIMAAVCTYLIMGAFFGAVLSAMEVVEPGSIHDPNSPGTSPPWQTMIYFSFITMATVGYGEILPVSPWARSVAWLEAVVGTLFLTIVIARLVGSWAGGRRVRPGQQETGDE